jgi:predicted amidohydrolase
VRAGIFQCDGGGLSPYERLAQLEHAISGQHLDLVVCPELFLSGYAVGDDVRRFSETQDGPFSNRVTYLAKQQCTAIVYGYPEQKNGELYNSAICIDNKGHVVSNHRKMLLPPGFESEYFTSGDQLSTFNLGQFKCAMLVCYDVEYPEAVRAASEAGAQIIIVPTALGEQWDVVAHKLIPTRAFENGVWVLYANHAGVENSARYLGNSCIVAPDGSDAIRAGTTQQLIKAEISLEAVTQAQNRLPYLKVVPQLRAIIHKEL